MGGSMHTDLIKLTTSSTYKSANLSFSVTRSKISADQNAVQAFLKPSRALMIL